MSEPTSEQPKKSGMAGWLKALIASSLSALSGAVLMYASPLVDMIIKPAKPVANFEAQASGLKATFQNKSTGGHEGWWDFGDGTALEPFVPDQLAVTHTYAKANSYAVKLSVKNLIGDENERTATVVVDEGGPSLPTIEALNVVAIQSDYAPATFRVETNVSNANLCVWALGNRPLEFNPDTANGKTARMVTFKDPGTHVLRLAAYNGKQCVEKTETIVVKKAPLGTMTATVDVVYEAVLVEQKTNTPFVQMRFPADQKGDVIAVTQAYAADVGFEIVKADLAPAANNPNIKSAKVLLDPAGRDKVLVTCELVRPPSRTPPPVCRVQLVLTQQHQSPPAVKTFDPVSMNLTLPGTTLVPLPSLPAGWVAKSRKMTLTVQQDAQHFAWKDANMPHNVVIQTTSRAEFLVNAVEQNGQLKIDMQPIEKAGPMVGN